VFIIQNPVKSAVVRADFSINPLRVNEHSILSAAPGNCGPQY